ncbi:MAG: glycosyl transferase [Deltaproteobacteria bacterium]|jgi:predicted glycosyltransferase|nr:glycosyl transferase [Deltaproteobacteria bacterium]
MKSNLMNILFYCQYVWGMGHLVRSLELARSLSDHAVTLVAGGQEVAVDLPDHVDLVRLPALYMDEMFTKLIAGDSGRTVAQIKQERKEILYTLFEQKQPDVFIVELYPFGRSIFGFELEPLLADIRTGKVGAVKTVCSLRDILVEKKDPPAYEERVLQKLNQDFDALLIHSDENLLRLNETFTREDNINIPVVYTGFIAQQADPANGRMLRQDLDISAKQKLIVASAGGGRSGYKLLNSVLDACELLRECLPIRLEVFTGPFMENEAYEKLVARSAPGIGIQRYTRRFLDYLYAADLSVSLAGYNTCMNLLVTQVPAIVYPYVRQREQPMRVNKFKNMLPMKILNDDDLRPDRLSDHIVHMLGQKRTLKTLPIDMNGAANAASFLRRWVNESII